MGTVLKQQVLFLFSVIYADIEALFERGIWYGVYNQNVEVLLVLVLEDFQPVTVKKYIKESYNSLSSVWCFI